ncbi:MAG: dTDP-glucose 4,6-dehydratase [Oscillospiraceae bacterium]|jgi:dTDP-glucose 4,6-dehydratase|nr:dTDP-glucose 4,6-dehydratase [Oscillospiraceae bacterium]
MKILITGAAGFIGSNHVYWSLEQHPEDTLVLLDALTYAGNIHTLKPALAQPNVTFVHGDITDRTLVFDLFAKERFDAILHFAAESFVDRSITHPGVFLQTNVLGTQVLLDAARAHGNVRFHQISTDEVYGDLPLDRPDLFFTEQTNLRTSSPYSASKAAADLLAQAYCHTYNLPVTISRCSNNYGRFQFPEKLIPLMITKALANDALPVYGAGANIRDWLHVDDHCRAIDLILRNGTCGEVYNIGGHNERDNLTVVKTILSLLGKPESLITFVTDRAGHDRRYGIDPRKIHQTLGWLPTVTFEDGIAATVQWYVDNPDWWRMILDGTYRSY